MRILLALLLTAALATGAWFALADPELPTVRTVALERGDVVRTLTLTGTVVNDFTVTLTALAPPAPA